MEFLRVFNKRRICIMLLLMIINAVLFTLFCSLDEIDNIYIDLIENYDEQENLSNLFKQITVDDKEMNDGDISAAKNAFKERYDYVKNYKKITQDKIDRINNSQKSVLFSEADGRANLELAKTKNDLNKALNYDVKLDNDLWLLKVKDYRYIYWIIGVGCIVIVFSFLAEKGKGEIIVFASKGGRALLLLRRIIILLLFSFVYVLINYILVSAIALLRYGGIDGIFNIAASSIDLQLCSYGVSRVMFVFLVCVQNSLVFFAWSIFVWALLSMFKNKNIGVVCVIAINLIEKMLYSFIDVKSFLRFFRYFNIYGIFEGENIWFNYENWGYSFFVMDSKESQLMMSFIILLAGFFILFTRYILKHPYDSMNFFEKTIESILIKARKKESKLPAFYFELKKVVIYQKAIIIIAIMTMILLNMSYGNKLKYNLKNSAMFSFCEEHRQDSLDELKRCKEQLEIEYYAFDSDDFTTDFNKALVEEKLDYLKYIVDKKNAGLNVSMVSQYQYESLFFEKQFLNQRIIAVLLIVLGLYVNSGLISYEKQSNMLMNIRSCKERKRWIVKKIVVNSTLLSIVAGMVYAYYYYQICNIYEIKDLNMGIQSIYTFSKYPFNISILGTLVLDVLLKILLINAIAVFGYLMTGVFRYMVSFLLSLIVLVPTLMELIGLKVFSYMSVVNLIAFFDYWKNAKFGVIYGEIIFVGIMAFVMIKYVLRKWEVCS